ncbi:(2Fe-2S)-binding protein [Thermaurantimonas aggregans]|uniref:(2Fe-2S)-binding protein n=1 Tax=Thermaurantimonas aggregans TaxID=2173829 RepID=A0A401XM47_9FLAO|nr:2Fe-2S iron-sulfur cluster binding domain-containing protein [Thermaurantimonas aggregans]MCX8147958.1 2Fe-2S iron-sulfur cluster binding domain-containing protein [Thermaurantimonas aggregans]GCD78089.1 (2Fe-2S)-binding protein [Thermaurantimonas aggregans]
MPILEFKGKTLVITTDKPLRNQLIEAGLSPHNGQSQWLNCKGLGTCGTCCIRIDSALCSEPTPLEKWRLNFPPFKNGLKKGLRLACQTHLLDDGKAEKGRGFWGEEFD